MTTVLTMEKDTKNTRRYDCPRSMRNHSVDLVYVNQEALIAAFGKLPNAIRITIEEVQ